MTEPWRVLAGRAGDEIVRRGWWQGSYGSDKARPADCRVCLFGAMNTVAYGDPFVLPADDHADFMALEHHLRGLVVVPWIWNDEPERTEGEVVGLLYAIADGVI